MKRAMEVSVRFMVDSERWRDVYGVDVEKDGELGFAQSVVDYVVTRMVQSRAACNGSITEVDLGRYVVAEKLKDLIQPSPPEDGIVDAVIRDLDEREFQGTLEACGDSNPFGLELDGEVVGLVLVRYDPQMIDSLRALGIEVRV